MFPNIQREFFAKKMPSRRKHRSRSSTRAKKSGRRRKHDSPCKKSCGAVSLEFVLKGPPNEACTKRYAQTLTGYALNFINGGINPSTPTGPYNLKASGQAILPVDATSIVVTWNLRDNVVEDDNDLTRYIISIDRLEGCDIVPIVKFRVPLSCVPKNDCEQVEKPQLAGTTQPFRVKLCAGDGILVGFTTILDDDCRPGICGAPGPTPTPEAPTGLTAVSFGLYAF